MSASSQPLTQMSWWTRLQTAQVAGSAYPIVQQIDKIFGFHCQGLMTLTGAAGLSLRYTKVVAVCNNTGVRMSTYIDMVEVLFLGCWVTIVRVDTQGCCGWQGGIEESAMEGLILLEPLQIVEWCLPWQLVHTRDDQQSLETCPFLRQTEHLPAFNSICLRASTRCR